MDEDEANTTRTPAAAAASKTPAAREEVPPHVLLEHVAEAPHARLSGQVEDAVGAGEIEVFLCEVEARHVEPGRVLLLQRRVVVVGEAIDCEHLVARREQLLGQLRADEAGCPGDDVLHSAGASGLSVPSPFGVRLRSEKKRVMTMPSRKSPSLGSSCSPCASASASSG